MTTAKPTMVTILFFLFYFIFGEITEVQVVVVVVFNGLHAGREKKIKKMFAKQIFLIADKEKRPTKLSERPHEKW